MSRFFRSPARIHLIAGARPNFMKIAPVLGALREERWCRVATVHTGQHYDAEMSDSILKDLGLPQPDYSLGVGSGSHAEQTGKVMLAYERICEESRPDLAIVVGDVNSTLACAITATKLGIPVAHLEAGLRSRDRSMPEEINRLLTDQISDFLWTPSQDADRNLEGEGIPPSRIRRVGNVMIDSLEMLRSRIECESREHEPAALREGRYVVLTLHRPSNVDSRDKLVQILDALETVSREIPIAFPIHPRTRKRLEEFGLWEAMTAHRRMVVLPPLGYIKFLGLVMRSACVVTDSGGIQEETSYLGIPCFTLRENTERPITIVQGTNRLVTPENLVDSVSASLRQGSRAVPRIELWDGKAALRIRNHLREIFAVEGLS